MIKFALWPDVAMKLLWFFKGDIPRETACDYCGRFSSYYLIGCPYCWEPEQQKW